MEGLKNVFPFATAWTARTTSGLRRIFEQVAFGPGSERPNQKLLIRVHAQNNDPDVWVRFANLGRRIEPIQLRHGNIHDDDVRARFRRQAHCLTAVLCFADHFYIRMLRQQEPQTLSHDTVIVGDQNANRTQAAVLSREANRTARTAPRPGSD